MTALAALIAEVEGHGARVWRMGDRLRIVPPGRLPAGLKSQLVARKVELLAVLPPAPPEVAALPAVPVPTEPEPWIVSSGSTGAMRLVVEAPPEDWPPAVWRAAALVEVLDVRTRADRADAQGIADQLERVLGELRRQGVTAWLTS